MFCPNCGTQNPDAAQACSKCSFHLKGVAAPKFKGTMLMMNQPPAPAAGGRPAAASPAAPGVSVPSKLKGTMVGVAPMAGPGRAMSAVAVPPAANQVTLPLATPSPGGPSLYGQGGNDGASGYSPPVPQPGVNPLGGTLAAEQMPVPPYGAPGGGPFGGPQAFAGTAPVAVMGGAPAAGAPSYPLPAAPVSPFDPSPPGGGLPYGAPPNQNYGAPPNQGYGGPPGQSYGAPAHQGYGAPPNQGYGAPPNQGYGAPSNQGYGAPNQGYGAPLAQNYGASAHQGYGASPHAPSNSAYPSYAAGVAALSTSGGPTKRNAWMTLLLPMAVIVAGSIVSAILGMILAPLAHLSSLFSLVGGIWFLLLAIRMTGEVKSVTQNASFAWWPILVPFLSIYWVLVPLRQEVSLAKQRLGVSAPARGALLYLFLWPYALAADINDMVR